MKPIFTHVWIAVPEDGMSYDQEDTLVGADLWLCVLEPNGVGGALKPWVYSGHRLSGSLGEGWYYDSHKKITDKVTHYMIRDFKPDLPNFYKY